MERRDYETFDHLATSLHFGRTARALAMSPSALTRRVQAMEDELGQALLLRDAKQVRLTAAGEIFRRFARAQLDQYEQLKNELRAEQESPTGELLVACTVTACHTVLPSLLSRFRRAYPGITLRLITQDAARSLLQLEAGEVDLAVIPTEPGGLAGFESKVLGHTALTFIAPPPDAALELEPLLAACPIDVGALPFVAPLGGLERTRLFGWFREQGALPHLVAEVRGNEGIIAMVRLGSGVALVPRLVLESSPLRDSVRELSALEPPPGYDVSLCARPRSLSRRVVLSLWQMAGEADE